MGGWGDMLRAMAEGAEAEFKRIIGKRGAELDGKNGMDKVVTAAKLLTTSGGKSTVHVHNKTAEPIFVIAAQNRESAFADLANSVISSLITLGTNAPNLVLSVGVLEKLVAAYHIVKTCGSLAYTGYSFSEKWKTLDAAESGRTIMEFLDKEAIRIEPGATANVYDYWYMNPSRYNSPSGMSDIYGTMANCTVMIVTKSMSSSIVFDTNSDDSWLVKPHEIVRARPGSVDQEYREAGFYRFGKGDRIVAGMALKPRDAIKSPNEKFDFVFEEDGAAVLYERAYKPAIADSAFDRTKTLTDVAHKLRGTLGLAELKMEQRVWRSGAGVKAPSELVLQNDGNLVIYQTDGQPVWASDTAGTGAAQLVLNDNGDLVLLDKNDKEVWKAARGQ